jgi:hypothetical protein
MSNSEEENGKGNGEPAAHAEDPLTEASLTQSGKQIGELLNLPPEERRAKVREELGRI